MGSVSDTLKAFIKTYAEIDPNDERMMLLDLSGQVSDLEEENRKLKAENARLREELARRKALECRGGAYYVFDRDNSETGPVCPQCFEQDGIVVLLEQCNGGARCSRCKTRYAGVEPAVRGFTSRIG